MGAQTITLSYEETSSLRSKISRGENIISTANISTPSDELLEKSSTINTQLSTNVIVDLATDVSIRLSKIEKDYTTSDQARDIAEEAVVVLG